MKKNLSVGLSIFVFLFIVAANSALARVVEIETEPVIVHPKKASLKKSVAHDQDFEKTAYVTNPSKSDRSSTESASINSQVTQKLKEVSEDTSLKTAEEDYSPSEPVAAQTVNDQNNVNSTQEMNQTGRRFIGNASDRDILNRAQPAGEHKYEPPIVSPLTSDIEIKERKIELGTEISHIIYKEPVFRLRDKGNMYGLFGSYIYRPNQGNDLYNPFLSMYRLDAKASYGKVDYESSGSGTIHHIDDYMIEIRGLLGKDYYLGKYSLLTPFAGLGWRYLNDDTGGRQSSTGASGYERESRYFYAPLGVEAAQKLGNSWLLSFNGEYDLFIIGQQTSHLSDVPGGFPDIKNKQHKGYGVRGSMRLLYVGKEFNFFMEPFFRYWHIRDSDTTTATGSRFIVTGLEPDNNSTEIGIKLGIQY